MNSSEYLELVDNKDAKEINVGDRVKVIDTGCAYSSYTEWVTKTHPNLRCIICIVLHTFTRLYAKELQHPHSRLLQKLLIRISPTECCILYKTRFARCFLLGEEGLKNAIDIT